ncbi:MAG: hypothetical protein A2Z99_14180 [Treponema sp. GWB1_62_6]|nr:MAG: hypothetical protein A2001_05840 [Treponema sp. GWC1_61_84]OHE70392.1 MAG: hypothetical protein A2413_15310 [Treponema sp. RIFOXYC1_FULL_61_9]OHE71048.1 MAG: hypothetical protein A2Z99_14180 [Treponema sp. GWB1_62_6]HCM26576.1 hypothetical protein [Treponema sp.]
MSQTNHQTPHHFHIPVLGTGFSVDTPIKVAPLGISSVISIVDDDLLERCRSYHCGQEGLGYEPIPASAEDARARRTREYLDLVGSLVRSRFQAILDSFPSGELARRYFDLLPAGELRDGFARLQSMATGTERDELEKTLKAGMRSGSIDVNIMTKLDRIPQWAGSDAKFSDASAALRGFATSSLDSSVVLSAGMNPRLFDYMAEFADFRHDASGYARKRIVIKVSDYRSAFVQGLQFARKGLWTSEFRVESGLNCGGHAFPTKGLLLGPILEEFMSKRAELTDRLRTAYADACKASGKPAASPDDLSFSLSVQGGVGTAVEHQLLRKRYGADSVGWGSPFLLVPEVTNVDAASLALLERAGEEDILLSEASPLGVPFWIVRGSASEVRRERRIAEGTPGTPCPKGYLVLNTEYSEVPICVASMVYQRLKLADLRAEAEKGGEAAARMMQSVLAKACLCRDLASSFLSKAGLEKDGSTALTAGPNLAYFRAAASLSDMVAHIYGRLDLLAGGIRPHFFAKEASVYLDFLRKELADATADVTRKGRKYFEDFRRNVMAGLEYYEGLSCEFLGTERDRFLEAIGRLKAEAEALLPTIALVAE